MKNILKQVREARIAVIGDIMLDRYITGTVERISPEAPVPVVFVTEESHVLGGAGNVAANLCQLVYNVDLFCRIADDSFGYLIKNELEALHNQYNNITTTYYANTQTTVKTRIMADNHQIVRFDRESPSPIKAASLFNLIDRLIDDKENIDAVLISDYGKGTITKPLLVGVYDAIGDTTPICIDPSPKTEYPSMPKAIILPNTKEKEKMKLQLESNFSTVIETAGADGIFIYHKGTTTHIEAIKVSDVVDTVGAGDTVTAVFTAAYATGAEIHKAAALANAAASVVVKHAKTYAASYNEIFEAIEHM